MGAFEQLIYEGALSVAGDPIFIGLLVFGFFLGFALLQGQKFAGFMLILVPGAILAIAFMPNYVVIILGLILGVILALALNKLITR